MLIKETSVAGSAPLCVGNGGQELFEFTPGSATYNGGLLEYIHRSDGNTRPDLNMYVAGAGAFKVYTNGANERLRIDSAGKVGIGTTIPTRSFDVRGDATIGIDQHSGNPGTTVGILTVRGHHVNSDSDYAQLYLANSNSSGGSTASIRANRDATSNYATSLSFFTNHTLSAGNGDERLRIGTTGQLGLSAGGVGVAATDYGTSGQVLTSGGASATATWTTPAGGGWVPVANNSVTSSDTTDVLFDNSSCFDSTYDHYRIEFTCHYSDISSSGQDYLQFRQYDSGSLRTSNDYDHAITYSGNGSGTRYHTSGATDVGYLSANQQNQAFQGRIDIWNVHETTIQATWNCWVNSYWIKQPWSVTNYNNLGINGVICACPSDNTAVAVTGIKIYSTGTFSVSYTHLTLPTKA